MSKTVICTHDENELLCKLCKISELDSEIKHLSDEKERMEGAINNLLSSIESADMTLEGHTFYKLILPEIAKVRKALNPIPKTQEERN